MIIRILNSLFIAAILFINFGCEREVDLLDPATNPTFGEVFLDGFVAGLDYSAFSNSKFDAFEIDKKEYLRGTSSIRITVPGKDDPSGSFAGGVFFSTFARDLSGYNALTFWGKANKTAIAEIGFGNDNTGNSVYPVMQKNMVFGTSWKKYIIPIPLSSKLSAETGMLQYAAAPDENGYGGQIWLDEVKYENLGTIAYPRPVISSTTIAGEVGDIIDAGVTGVTFNVNGVDQTVNAASAYFTLTSSNESVAIPTADGKISAVSVGTAEITVKLGSIEASEKITVNVRPAAPRPATPAPTPTVSADSVISLFSNAYSNVVVDTWNPFWEFSTAEVEDIQIAGNDVKRYTNLNFVGIEFTSQTIDATNMTHFHIDIWTADPAAAAEFSAKLVDFGADNAFGGGDDSEAEVIVTSPTLVSENWIGVDLALAGLANRGHVAQLILVGNDNLNTVYIDNAYFYIGDDNGGTGNAPTEAAPTPTQDAADVISIFSDAYTNIESTDFYPDWGQATVVSEVPVAGNNTLLYKGLNYQGVVLASSQDVSSMENLHIDVWTENSTALNVYLISTGPAEKAFALTVPTTGWASVDIPLTSFSDVVDLADIIQLKFDGDGNIYLDNIYFYKGSGSGGDTPTEAAPIPTQDAADVFSIYSDTYTDLENTNFNPNWGQSTVQTFEVVDGDNTIKYDVLNYQGTNLGSADGGVPQDVSGYDYLHVDFWMPNATALNFFILDQSEGEVSYSLPITTGQWVSVDIPLSHYSGGGENLADIHQFKVDGGDGVSTAVWFDNWYFYKDGGGGGATEPDEAAPIPTQDAADVFSIYSDTYTDLENTNFNPNWGQSTVQTFEVVDGDNTIKYDVLNYQGTNLGSADGGVPQDVSGYDYLHVDFWTPNATALNFFILDQSEGEVSYSLPITTGEWISVDIPLSHFLNGGENLTDIHQFKVDGGDGVSTVVWFDNWYFYKESGSAESDASLSDLQVDGSTIAGFNPNTLNYSVKLPEGTTVVPTVTVTENNSNASSVITPAGSIPGMTTIVVTAQDGTTERTYSVAFSLQTQGDWTTDSVIDFESGGYGADWSWNVFENDANPALEFVSNPDASGANTSATVAKFTALQAGQPYAGCETVHGDIGSFTFSADNATVRIMVYKTVSSDVGLKFAEANGEAQPEIKVANTKINEWEELTFDLSGSIGAGITGIIDQIIVFPDFNARAQDNVIYFDNIRFSSN